MKGAGPGAATAWTVAAALGLLSGCATRDAWQQDESRRIAEIMGTEKFSEDMPEVKGTSFLAPESSAPPLSTSKYAIQNRPPKKRSKSSRGGRGAEVGSSTRAQRAGSKSRHKRDEEVTSQSAESDSSSRQP